MYVPVLSSSLTTASTCEITSIHIEMNCRSLKRHKFCCPNSSAEDIIMCLNLMLQILCSHVVKDYILKHIQETSVLHFLCHFVTLICLIFWFVPVCLFNFLPLGIQMYFTERKTGKESHILKI